MPLNESSARSEATANKLLSTAETLELLDGLRRAVRDIVTRAEEAERDFTARSNRLRAQFEQSVASERERWSTEIAAGKAAATTQRERVESNFARRKSRIGRALENARKRRLAEIEGTEGRRTRETQHGLLEADRQRDADTQNNKANHEAFTVRLATEQAALATLEARARATLGGRGALAATREPASLDLSANENQLVEQLRGRLEKAESDLARSRRQVLPVLFRFLPIWLCVLLILIGAFLLVPEIRQFNFAAVPNKVWGVLSGCLAGAVVGHLVGKAVASPRARTVASALHDARTLHGDCAQKAQASFAQETKRIQADHTSATQQLNHLWKQVVADSKSLRNEWTRQLEEQARNLQTENEERKRRGLLRIEENHAENTARSHQEVASRTKQIETLYAENVSKLEAAHNASRQAVETDWRTGALPPWKTLQAARGAAEKIFPLWRAELWKDFTLPNEFVPSARFAELAVDVEKFCAVSLAGRELAFPGPT